MRGFSDDDTDAQEGYVLQETWRINDEGEVELAFEMDPSESPPSPSGAPACLDNGPSTQQEPANLTPREPTPTLMMHIGHVCPHCLDFTVLIMTVLSLANGSPPFDVFHVLDQLS